MLYSNRHSAFTLVELLVVVSIIAVLAGLVLGVSGNVQKNAAKNRAKAEIAAIELALERYKIDNGDYPIATGITTVGSGATARYNGIPTNYLASGRILFQALAGRANFDEVDLDAGAREYMEFKPSQIASPGSNSYIIDPFGFAYGYFYNSAASPRSLFNEVVPDIWSTGGNRLNPTGANAHLYLQWVANWPNN